MRMFGSEVEVIQLIHRIFYDGPPDIFDAVFLFSETQDNEKSVLNMGALLNSLRNMPTLFITKGEGLGYPGEKRWRNELVKLGVKEKSIYTIEYGNTPNTLTEAEGLIDFLQNYSVINSVGIVAAPFHQLRAYVTTVSVAVRKNAKCKIYSCPGEYLPWGQKVLHSQGVLEATMAELIGHELERIERYYAKGDLLPARQILDYMDKR